MSRAITASALIVAALAASTAFADLRITEVAPQTTAGTPSTINGDWWELSNSGPGAIDLAGYQWADTEDALPSSDSNFFPAITISPGQSIIILEESASSLAAWRANWGIPDTVVILGIDAMLDDATPDGDTFSGLGNTNDGVFFYDPSGVQLSSYLYAANTRGVSFEADMAGNDLGLSVVGENGAVLGANGDIASPGFAVPAPGAMSMLALGAVLARRRR
ncbi:MAG: lamin tail domain-containing protein [Phycisphaerales bacterium]|nr:lamin tail domain-containing protein [Phycisphaerales bacterium]